MPFEAGVGGGEVSKIGVGVDDVDAEIECPAKKGNESRSPLFDLRVLGIACLGGMFVELVIFE